jgi:SAM-dependent methyltransferase
MHMNGTTPPVDRLPTPVQGDQRQFLPAMGRRWLLPLYDPFTRLLGVRALHQALLEAADLRPGHRVLEIGCGTGNLALLAKAHHPEATVVGLDPDLEALARAQRKALRRGLAVQFDRGTAGELPYADGSVDRVLSSLMLHHLPAGEKPRALAEVRRVLAPGGELHLVDISGVHDAHGPHRGWVGRVRRGHRDGGAHAGHRPGHGLSRPSLIPAPADDAHLSGWHQRSTTAICAARTGSSHVAYSIVTWLSSR